VCHKFQGDSLAKAIRQHIARHILQSEDDWLRRYNVLKPEFPCMLCGIRDLHGIDLGRDTNAIDLCYMWFESWTSQPTLYCILFQEMKPYGFLASANKSRLKSVRWKDSKSAEPSSNVPIQCPGCKKVFWKQYLHKHFSQKHANLTMSRPRPPLLSQVSQCTCIKEIMSRVSSRIWDEPRRWLSSVSTMTRTHTTVIVHYNTHTHNRNEVTGAHESVFTSISVHIHTIKNGKTRLYIYVLIHLYFSKSVLSEFLYSCLHI